mmetsp:Transcript_145796/g.257140  ORF Transcript_145796/g.257140 Transcript_145796/m.257140 type:complete len:111 (+) Transcript_145796:460-792(+)
MSQLEIQTHVDKQSYVLSSTKSAVMSKWSDGELKPAKVSRIDGLRTPRQVTPHGTSKKSMRLNGTGRGQVAGASPPRRAEYASTKVQGSHAFTLEGISRPSGGNPVVSKS